MFVASTQLTEMFGSDGGALIQLATSSSEQPYYYTPAVHTYYYQEDQNGNQPNQPFRRNRMFGKNYFNSGWLSKLLLVVLLVAVVFYVLRR